MPNLIYKTRLNLFFRGTRDYIYGPDLFDTSMASVFEHFGVNGVKHVSFSSHSMTRSGLDFILFDNAQNENEFKFNSKLEFKLEDKSFYGYLVENGEEVETRIPYPEENIVGISKLDSEEKSITITKETNFKITDNYTALTKFMHNKLYPEINGKWIFVRVSYPEYSKEMRYDSLKVINRKMFDQKYSQNILLCNGVRIGVLNFALI